MQNFYETLYSLTSQHTGQVDALREELQRQETIIEEGRKYAQEAIHSGEQATYQKWSGKADFAVKRAAELRKQIEELEKEPAISQDDYNALHQELNKHYATAVKMFHDAFTERFAALKLAYHDYKTAVASLTGKDTELQRAAGVQQGSGYQRTIQAMEELQEAGNRLQRRIDELRKAAADQR